MRHQRVLKGRSPDEIVRSRLAAEPKIADLRSKPPDPGALPQALQVVAVAKEISHPDSLRLSEVDLKYSSLASLIVLFHPFSVSLPTWP
jgi:hypothetical protein